MCDFCGCPQIEPFMRLIDDHVTLVIMAEVFERSRDPLDLHALRITWDDHRVQERAATRALAARLSVQDAMTIGEELDRSLEALLREEDPDPRRLRGAVIGHVDGYEYEVFSPLVMAADPAEIDEAARRSEAVRVM